jgi:hypothetical protein
LLTLAFAFSILPSIQRSMSLRFSGRRQDAHALTPGATSAARRTT